VSVGGTGALSLHGCELRGGCRVTGDAGADVLTFEIIGCRITSRDGEGLYVSGDAAGSLRSSIVADCVGHGVRTSGHVAARIDACTITGNAGAGIHVNNTSADTIHVGNSVVWGNGGGTFYRTADSPTPSVRYSLVGDAAPLPGTGNIVADPLFVDAANGDYRLQPDSPCIDAGDPALLDSDGSRSDIGAIRYGESWPLPVAHDATPLGFSLAQNAPNPFNPRTTFRFSIPEAGVVRLVVYDVNGRWVRTLVDEYVDAGAHSVTWDGTDDVRRAVGSGVYVYRLTWNGGAETRSSVRRCLLLR